MKTNSIVLKRRDVSLMKNEQEELEQVKLPLHRMATKYSSRKRARAHISVSSLVGVVIYTSFMISYSSGSVAADDNVIRRNNIGQKNFIDGPRYRKRSLSGTWNWNEDEDDLPLNAVGSKSYKATPNGSESASKSGKSKSNKNEDASSEWSSKWSTRWSSPQKPSLAHTTPWKAAAFHPTTLRPTTASKPVSKVPTKPTVSTASPTKQTPTDKPTNGVPTNSPTKAFSPVPSMNPSYIPTSSPTTHPSSTPSKYPSSKPSSMPSTSPSISPSSSPSRSPSSTPTTSPQPSPKYMPSATPSISSQPTSSPSASPSVSPTVSPSSSPSSSPSVPPLATTSPTVSSSPTTSQRTRRPTWAPTISVEPSWAERTRRPTWAPTISNSPTNADRTMRPTLSPLTEAPTPIPLPTGSPTIAPQTLSPTPSLIIDSRTGLRMELFGLSLLDETQVNLFQDRTQSYIEAFYNQTDSTNLLDLIKKQVTDLTVVVTVDQQDPPDLLGDFRGRLLEMSRMNEKRELQDEVTEPCIGASLAVTFNMDLTYRASEPSLEFSDRVISFPFRTIPFKRDYLENYLKADDEGAFDDLYCTSQIIFPGGETSAPTGSPTLLSTSTTSSPSVASSVNETLAPTTTSQPSIAPSGSMTAEPTLSEKPTTMEPSVNGTLAPSSSNIPTVSENTTLIPTTSISPSSMPSYLPSTVTQEPPAEPDLRMDMFGLTRELDSLGVLLYNERTAEYIESFYNDFNSTEGIRGQVLNVTATVVVTDQIVPDTVPLIEDEFRLVRQPRYSSHEKNDNIIEIEDDESYLPEHGIDSSDNFVNARYRLDGDSNMVKKPKGTRILQIESCSGEKIELVFNVSLTYRLTNTSWVEQDIIAEPFRTVLRRNIYMDEFLKGLDAGPFVGLTCTGDVLFPSGDTPTTSPTSVTIAPTLDGERPSHEPSVFVTSNETIVPTLDGERPSQQPSIFVTSNETNVPTLDGESPSQQPSVFATSNETNVPTLDVERPSQRPSLFATSNETNVPTLGVTSNETNVPTLGVASNETDVPTLGVTSNETNVPTLDGERPSHQPSLLVTAEETSSSAPTLVEDSIIAVRSNVGQDLFGILSLDPVSMNVYNEQTAAYISAFYEEDPFVSISSVLVSVTDEDFSEGPLEGDCSEIDPLTVSFNIEMTYSTTNPVTTFEELIKLPFSTTSFQDRFISEYLQANDLSGGFSTLQCVSGLIISEPPIATTSSPTESSVPSLSPTEFEDDLFNDLIRTGPLPQERSCIDKIDPKLIDSSEEIEISFVYGVESKTVDYFFLDELEELILDFLEVSVLMCLEGGLQTSPQVWRIDNEQGKVAGVMRVRYPEIEATSSMTKCEPTLTDAKGCAILSTKVFVTSVGVPVNKVHHDILMLLNEAFREGAFVAIIPELILTSYVGPDLEEYQLQTQTVFSSTSSQEEDRQSSRIIALSFSVTVIVIAGLVTWFSFPMVRQEVVKSAVAFFTRRRRPANVEENALIVYGQGDRSTDGISH